MHGGKSPAVRAAAKRRLQEQQALAAAKRLGIPIDVDPADALLELVRCTAGEVRFWRDEVERLAESDPRLLTGSVTRIEQGTGPRGSVSLSTTEAVPHVAYRMWVDAQERLARYAVAAIRVEAGDRVLSRVEEDGAIVAGVIRRILDRLDLTPAQQVLAGEVAPEELRAVARSREVER